MIQNLTISEKREEIIASNSREIAVWSYSKKILHYRITNKFNGKVNLNCCLSDGNDQKGVFKVLSTFDGESLVIGLNSGKIAFQSVLDFDNIHYFNFHNGNFSIEFLTKLQHV